LTDGWQQTKTVYLSLAARMNGRLMMASPIMRSSNIKRGGFNVAKWEMVWIGF
jgi:hypothetical protein